MILRTARRRRHRECLDVRAVELLKVVAVSSG
jgi:hypothetical protein